MLFWLLAPALVAASSCSNTITDNDDHEYLFQTNLLVTKETDMGMSQIEQDELHAKLEEAQTNIEELSEKLTAEKMVAKKMQEAAVTQKKSEVVASQLEELTAKLEAAEARKEVVLRTLERASMARNLNKAKMLESKMDASWEEATAATEAALVAERQAESRRQQADKAAKQNADQRAEAAALRQAEAARREQVMALRETRGSTDTANTKAVEAQPVPHVKHVKHPKAAVIKTRRAQRRAEDHAAELSAQAVNKSSQAWQWKKMYEAVHPKAINEEKTLVSSQAEVASLDKEKEDLISKKMKLEDQKMRLDEKVAKLSQAREEDAVKVTEATAQ
jgi:hypothetical protein